MDLKDVYGYLVLARKQEQRDRGLSLEAHLPWDANNAHYLLNVELIKIRTLNPSTYKAVCERYKVRLKQRTPKPSQEVTSSFYEYIGLPTYTDDHDAPAVFDDSLGQVALYFEVDNPWMDKVHSVVLLKNGFVYIPSATGKSYNSMFKEVKEYIREGITYRQLVSDVMSDFWTYTRMVTYNDKHEGAIAELTGAMLGYSLRNEGYADVEKLLQAFISRSNSQHSLHPFRTNSTVRIYKPNLVLNIHKTSVDNDDLRLDEPDTLFSFCWLEHEDVKHTKLIKSQGSLKYLAYHDICSNLITETLEKIDYLDV